MKLVGDWLHSPAAQRILSMLATAGFEALFVGGCVRNQIAGLPVADIDIATDALPAVVIELAEAAGFRAVPTGVDHGTVTLVLDGKSHEVTTFRKDVSTDGRRAVVAFSRDITEDARRRDFTINALYARSDGALVDPLEVLPDLLSGRVRFIGDAGQRIREDYLRILRFFRFQAWFGNPKIPMDKQALAACAANLDGIRLLSRERVGAEMRKLLSAPNPVPAMLEMERVGALARALPGAAVECLPRMIVLEQAAAVAPRWQRRLAAIGGIDPDRDLRLSRLEGRDLAAIRLLIVSGDNPRQAAQRFGAAAAVDATLVRCARTSAQLPPKLLELANSGAAESFPIRAADLAGYTAAGPDIGRELDRLRRIWLASDMTLSRAQLLSRVSEHG